MTVTKVQIVEKRPVCILTVDKITKKVRMI